MNSNHIYSDGQKNHIKELRKQQVKEIREVKNSASELKVKVTLIKAIMDKFRKLVGESDDSLFLTKKKMKRIF